MHLEAQTVAFTSLMLSVLVNLFSWALVLKRSSPRWRLNWALSNTFLMAGAALLLQEDVLPLWFSVFLGNLCLLSGYVLLELGMRRFTGRPFSVWFLWAYFGVVALVYLVLTNVVSSYQARTIARALAVVFIMSRLVFLLWTAVPEEKARNPWFVRGVMVIFVAVALFYLGRAAVGFTQESRSSLLRSDSYGAMFLFLTLSMTAWNLGFFILEMLRNQRLLEMSLAMRDKMFTMIAHDLRGPVGSLAAILETIQESTTSPEDAKVAIQLSANAARGSYNLLEDLLTWARSQSGELSLEPRTLEVSEAMDTAVAPLTSMAESKGVKLERTCDPGLLVFADSPTLEAILRNLVSNSVKFTPRGGTVKVDAWKQAGAVAIRVMDTGTGLPHAVLAQLNQGQLMESKPGTEGEQGSGLGLPLCREFVKANKGSLRFVSSDKGTEVTVLLPLPAENA